MEKEKLRLDIRNTLYRLDREVINLDSALEIVDKLLEPLEVNKSAIGGVSGSDVYAGQITKSKAENNDCYQCRNHNTVFDCDNKCVAPAGYHYR